MQQIEADKKRRSRSELGHYEFQNPEITLDQESKVNRMLKKTAQKAVETTDITIKKTIDAAEGTLKALPPLPATQSKRNSWAQRDHNQRSAYYNKNPSDISQADWDHKKSPSDLSRMNPERQGQQGPPLEQTRTRSPPRILNLVNQLPDVVNNFNPLLGNAKDVEAQQAERNKLSETLFAGLNDELEDLSHEQRDALVQRAFQHSALRSKRPVIWIPGDDLGVSDDEINRTAEKGGKIWISNVRQALNDKGNVVFNGAPPDFDEVELITL